MSNNSFWFDDVYALGNEDDNLKSTKARSETLAKNSSFIDWKLSQRGFKKDVFFWKSVMIPILSLEAIYFIVLFVYFLFADIWDVAMIGFYGYEMACLFLFGIVSVILLIFFFPRDPFLIVETILMAILMLLDAVVIALSIVEMDETDTST